VPTFKTQKRDVILVADPARVPAKNAVVRGQVEIITQNVLDEHGGTASRADKWTVDCYITVVAKPTDLVIQEAASGSPIDIFMRSGATTSVPLTLVNRGEVEADVIFQISGAPDGITVSPDKIHVPGEKSVGMTVNIKAGADMPAGSQHVFWVQAMTANSSAAKVALSVKSQSPFEFLKGLVVRAFRKPSSLSSNSLDSTAGQRLLPPPAP
jgi:hypothetical protein